MQSSTVCCNYLSLSRLTARSLWHPQIQTLGAEVLAHLRSVVPGDAFVAGLNMARQSVTTQRADRRKRQAVQVGKTVI
jgi:hypothetical protein